MTPRPSPERLPPRSQLHPPMEALLPQPPPPTQASLSSTVKNVLKLYLIGLVICLLTAFVGLMEFLGSLVPFPSPNPTPAGQRRQLDDNGGLLLNRSPPERGSGDQAPDPPGH